MRGKNAICSKRKVDALHAWDQLEAKFTSGEVFEAEVKDVVKGGLVVDLGVRGFVPASLVEDYFVEDFEDVKTMMKGSGMALMGCGIGNGPDRIDDAIKEAFESPLLNDFDLKTAKNVLINITAGHNDQGLKMNDLNEINQKINEYTGGANNFKRGLIWDEDPSIGDTIHITAIATGFKFNTLIGPDVNLGNYIQVDKDYCYDRNELIRNEGLSLPSVTSQIIGFNNKENTRTFHFDPDKKPCLLAEEGQALSELENTPAIRRLK